MSFAQLFVCVCPVFFKKNVLKIAYQAFHPKIADKSFWCIAANCTENSYITSKNIFLRN